MIRRLLLILCFFWHIHSISHAQTPVIDSLKQELEKHSGNAKLSSQIYYEITKKYMSRNLDTAIFFADKAVSVAQRANHTEELGKAYIILTVAYIESGQITKGIETGYKALHIAQNEKNYRFQYYAERNLAELYRRFARFDSSLSHGIKSIKVAEKYLSDTQEAAAYGNVAGLYNTIKDYEKAIEFNKKALALRMQLKDSEAMAYSYGNLGLSYREMGKYALALDYFRKSHELNTRFSNSSTFADGLNNIGSVYSKMGLLDSAEYYLKKCIDIREQMKEFIELPYTYAYLGENYARKKDIHNAEIYLKKSLRLAIENENNKQRYEAYESLANLYSSFKMYDSAYTYLNLYNSFRDSMRGMDNEALIHELNTRFATEQKEKLIQEQQFELTRKNYLLTGSILVLLIITIIIYSYYKRRQLREQAILQSVLLKQQETATRAVMEAEENERKRIAADLHDGVGQMMSAAKINLSTISGELGFKDEAQKLRFENALKLVDDSCTEVRNVSHNIMPNVLLRKNLDEALRAFISKIDERIIHINLYTDGLKEAIDDNIEIMIYRVVQECVNNVIKHSGASKLDIALVKDKYEISITIEDNGKGFDTGDKTVFNNIGMKSIRSRIEYLKGTVEWDSAPGRGTVVSMHVPV